MVSELGCLPFERKIWLVRPLYNGKRFSKLIDQPDGISLTIYLSGIPSRLFGQKKAWKQNLCKWLRKFSSFRSEQKNGVPLEVVQKLQADFPENYPTV